MGLHVALERRWLDARRSAIGEEDNPARWGDAVIARYSPWVDHSLTAIMREVESGEWVKYAEVLALEARVTTLETELEWLKNHIDEEA
jgi:hypothetical protein